MGLMSAMVCPETVTVKQVRRGRKPAEHEKMPKMSMKGGATGSQLAAVTLLTLLALGAGVVLAGLSGGVEMGPNMHGMSMPHADGPP
jgi:hypothetical protein